MGVCDIAVSSHGCGKLHTPAKHISDAESAKRRYRIGIFTDGLYFHHNGKLGYDYCLVRHEQSGTDNRRVKHYIRAIVRWVVAICYKKTVFKQCKGTVRGFNT